MRMVAKTDECWLWTGPQNLAGYGSFGVGRGSKRNAHRWLWEQINGRASPKLHLDHLCRNRLCVRPEHMELVTHSENIRRGARSTYQSDKTQCVHGHPYDEVNTAWYRGTRYCRTCKREATKQRRDRLRQAGTLSNR
ncbi:HNH endonuclease [Micromonospora krabiensis]|uniref:HNH endonuclease n=2 Tax=Micromonospora krabiensis TaxID=307121 RepID=A0A1C3N4R4_9ACTN|nr:HNH endonuclease [Micromonospora krabiensis]